MGDAAVAPLPVQEAAQLTLVDVPASRHEWEELVPAPTDPERLGRAPEPMPGEPPCLEGAQYIWEGDKPSQDRPGFRYPPGAGVDREDWLSAEEEAELVQAAKAGDRQARARLIRAHDPLVASVVLSWKWDSPWYEGLLQEGRRALVRALEMYKPEKGIRFGPYAKSAVQNAVWDKAALLKHPLEPSKGALRFRRKAKRARRVFRQKHLREPWYGELAPMLFPEEWPEGGGLDPERVEKKNALIDRVGLLLSEISPYITELDDDGADRRHKTEKPRARVKEDACPADSLHELAEGSDPATYPDMLEGVTEAQEDRDCQEARGEMIADLLDSVPGLTDRMRFCVRGTLGLDGDGFKAPKELAEELSEGVKHTVRPDSVQRTLRRAARRIREHMQGADVEAVDPFSVEEWAPDRGLLDAFAVAREEEPARWAAAVREVLGEDPDHPAGKPGRSTPRRIGPPPEVGAVGLYYHE